MRKGLYALLICIMLLTTQVCLAEEKVQRLEQYKTENAYHLLVNAWGKTLDDEEADAAFLGDSLTAMGKWDEYYSEYLVENLGVVADTIADVESRLVLVEKLEPYKCFLMIGINDLCLEPQAELAHEKVLQAYDALLAGLYALSEESGMTVYVQSILPILEGEMSYSYVKNQNIRKLNADIAVLAEKYGMSYIDVHPLLADGNGQLKSEYTTDGLHLNPIAYEIWSEALKPYVEE